MTYEQEKTHILNQPWYRNRLKDAIRQMDDMDPVDAYKDACILNNLMDKRCREMWGVKADTTTMGALMNREAR